MRYVISAEDVDRVVVGVNSLDHLQQIASASNGCLSDLPDWPDTVDPALANPSLWQRS